MGKYWEQPAGAEIAIDESVAMMTSRTFKKLLDYTCSIPTGTFVSKMWRAQINAAWYLQWYARDPDDPKCLLILKRPIVIVD